MMPIAWQAQYAKPVQRMQDSGFAEFIRVLSMPGMISFFAGLPDPSLYPVEDLKTAFDYVLDEEGSMALRYAPPQGYPPLRAYLAEKMTKEGIQTHEDNIIILSGSIQGLDLVGELLIDPGDAVVVENPTFSGAVEVFDKYGARYLTVPVDEEGMQVDLLPEILTQERAKFIYIMPDFQNPTGVNLPASRRKSLLEISDHYGVPVVSDDPYGELRYAGKPPPPLATLDGGANVIMIRSFSKILAPGLRLGWLVAPREIMGKLLLLKQSADRCTNHVAQRAAYEFCRRGMLDKYRQVLVDANGQKLETMLASMSEHFPANVHWTRPEGGYFVWVTLPDGIDGHELYRRAVERKVTFFPGSYFFANGGGENTLRLCFSTISNAEIPEGIERLGQLIKEML